MANTPSIKDSTQTYLGSSFDPDYGLLQFEPMGFDGDGMRTSESDDLALKLTESGSIKYVATASPGTAQSAAKWKCIKIDKTSGVVITYADGNANYDNVATDLTALSYS